MTNRIEIPSLTPMRGIAALWVMIFHLDVAIFYRDLGPLIDHDSTGLLQKGYLWVDFFFILSGFIIAHVYAKDIAQSPTAKTIGTYLWARFSRIYPLHLFTLLLAVIGSSIAVYLYPAVVDGSWGTYFDHKAIPSNLLMTHSMKQHTYLSWNIASWSIAAEWWTYIFAIPLIVWMTRKGNAVNIILAIIAFALLSWLTVTLGKNKLDITFDYGYLRCLFEFTIGLALYRAFDIKAGESWLKKDRSIIVILLSIIIVFHLELHDLIIIPLFALLILSLSFNTDKSKALLGHSVFQYLGKISYSIYLMHSLWFLVYWNIFPHIQWTLIEGELTWSIKLAYLASFTFLTIVSSHISYYIVEVPGRRALKKLIKTNSPQNPEPPKQEESNKLETTN